MNCASLELSLTLHVVIEGVWVRETDNMSTSLLLYLSVSYATCCYRGSVRECVRERQHVSSFPVSMVSYVTSL